MKVSIGNGLLLANVLVAALATTIALSPSATLRIILGLPFVLFVPGYVLIAALFPGKERLDGLERIALSFAASVPVVALSALLTNYMPWGIRLYPVLICLIVFIFATSIVAWWRQRRLAQADRLSFSFTLSLPHWRGQSLLVKSLSTILAATILAVVGTLGYIAFSPRVGERFTEFYIVGPEGMARDYPNELRMGEEGRVTVGIINREHETVSYRVEVTINGVRGNDWGPVVLDHDEKREEVVGFYPVVVGDNQKVEFLLYRDGQSEPYLKPLHLRIDVRE